jgi:hypothetical protein
LEINFMTSESLESALALLETDVGGGRKPKTGQLRFCNSRNFATYANKSTTTKKFNSNLVGIQFYGLKSPRISTCIIKN